jgi:uncharacterized oligopeptide transporter (OPT) family protein
MLEHNIVQTTGSAGESVAAAVVFSVPALIFLGYPLQVGLTTMIALTGGMLGVLMMVPLRRYLIVKEHGVLRYPEGKAAAEILRAGEPGDVGDARSSSASASARRSRPSRRSSAASRRRSRTALRSQGRLARLRRGARAHGRRLHHRYRTSLMMVAGSLLASLVLVPMIVLFGEGQRAARAGDGPDPRHVAGDVWANYVKHIGAGAVATGGIFALVRALPSIVSSVAASARASSAGERRAAPPSAHGARHAVPCSSSARSSSSRSSSPCRCST